jgi:hypothetical protein
MADDEDKVPLAAWRLWGVVMAAAMLLWRTWLWFTTGP